MKQLILAGALALTSIPAQSAIIFLPYELTSPDDLSSINVGQTIHLEANLLGLSPHDWLTTSLFNMQVNSSDSELWSAPFNISYSSDFNPIGVSTYVDTGKAELLYSPPFGNPLISTTDFVLGFDITSVAAGTGLFSLLGADVFSEDGIDLYVSSRDSLDFTITDTTSVPEPGTLLLFGTMMLFGLTRRDRKETQLQSLDSLAPPSQQ